MAENVQAEAQGEWLGLGRAGWVVYVIVALMNLAALTTFSDPVVIVAYTFFVIVGAYLLIRFYKAILSFVTGAVTN